LACQSPQGREGACGESTKHQNPSTKEAPNIKLQSAWGRGRAGAGAPEGWKEEKYGSKGLMEKKWFDLP
jgi:hypothetical protein